MQELPCTRVRGAQTWVGSKIEGCDVTAGYLLESGPPIIEAMKAVTKVEGEPLEGYCERILANPIGLRVKRADIDDNTDPARTAALSEHVRLRLATKYARVRSLLGFPQPR